MTNISSFLLELLQGGLGNLASYLAAHVLLCLLPAFYIAGAMTALIPKETVTRFLGRNTPKAISYPAAALAGSVLAVCSCTIVPLFAGIYKKGAGIGPAITFLFFAPAANILALIYTGGVIGADLAIARLTLSLAFGIGIGMIMALIFRREDAEHDKASEAMFAAQGKMRRVNLVFLLILVALLLSGTLKIGLLTNTYATLTIPVSGMDKFQDFLYNLVPYDCEQRRGGSHSPGRHPDRSIGPDRVVILEGHGKHLRRLQPLDMDCARSFRPDAFSRCSRHVSPPGRVGHPRQRQVLWRTDCPCRAWLDPQNRAFRGRNPQFPVGILEVRQADLSRCSWSACSSWASSA